MQLFSEESISNSRRQVRTRPRYLLFQLLIFLAAWPAGAAEICAGGEIIWTSQRIQIGCRFELPSVNTATFIERSLPLCKGTDWVGFQDGQLLCFQTRLSPPDGIDYSGLMVGPNANDLQPARLTAFERGDACQYVSTGALAWWPLDGRGDATIEWIDHNRLTLQGTRSISGRTGSALVFDGVDDHAQSLRPLNLGTGDFTIEAWVRTSQIGSVGTLLDQRVRRRLQGPSNPQDLNQDTPQEAQASQDARREPDTLAFRDAPLDGPISQTPVLPPPSSHVGFSLFLYQGRPGLQLADGPHRNFVSSRVVADGDWHHVAVTVDRDQSDGIRWYVDGSEVMPRQDPTGFQGSLSNAGPLRLGLRSFERRAFYDGGLDEVLIHDRVLHPLEVQKAVDKPRCKTCGAAATCEFAEVIPANPQEFQSVDFIGFVHPQPGCFYQWAWEVNGVVVASTPSVNGFTGLAVGPNRVCLNVVDDCSPIPCRSCRMVNVSPSSPSGNFCGRSFAEWRQLHEAGQSTIIDERASDRVFITGTDGPDLILGNDLANTIEGRGDDDCIYGFGGDDFIHGDRNRLSLVRSGADEIHGGAGNDHLRGDAGNDRLFGEDGNDFIEGDAGNDVVSGGAGTDRIHGDSGHDTLRGDGGPDCLVGDAGNDVLRGGAGNDDLKGDSGRDQLFGDAGRDALKGDSGRDEIHGGPGNDLLKGDSSGDDLFGNAGDDRLCGDGSFTRRDQLDGGSGRDGCRSGRRVRCESRPPARDCQTQDWRDWNSNLSCP